MEFIFEFFLEIIFRRIIVGFFGYYTLYACYKIINDKKSQNWLEEAAQNEGEEFGKGCLISVVGLVSFTTFFVALGYTIDYFFY